MRLEQIREIVGDANVVQNVRDVSEVPGHFCTEGQIQPRYIARPDNTAQVQELVALARKNKTPLVPVSSGAPHFHGGSFPSIGGSIVVDMSRLKRIIHIDRKNRAAMFEPGVTYGELIPALAEEGLRLNMPLLPRPTKSIAGSMLDREPVTMPKYHWDISDPLACMEIIFGTGDMFRTGAAAGSGTIEEQWAAGGAQKEAAGPSSASWYRLIQGAQGTMGIVTWVSARCELLPSLEEPLFVGSNNLGDLLEITHWLIRLRLVNECFIVNNTSLAAVMAQDDADRSQSLRDSLPQWILFYNVAAYEYFPQDRITGQKKDIRDIVSRQGLEPSPSIGDVPARYFLNLIQQPSAEPYWKFRYKGDFQDVFCLSDYDGVPGLVDAMESASGAAGYPVSDIGVYLQPIVQGVNWHCEFTLFYDGKNRAERLAAETASQKSVSRLMSGGGFFSRPYGPRADVMMNRDAAGVAVLKKIKAIVDPDNIMNPGKLCF